METSAIEDLNVRDCFEQLVQEIYNVQSQQELANRRKQNVGQPLTHNDPNFTPGGGRGSCGCM